MRMLKNGHIPKVLANEYASYRDQVIEVLSAKLEEAEHSKSRPLVLYDPMAGTSPLLPQAERRGYTAYFNDLNNLHFYINTAKSFRSYINFMNIGPAKLLSIVRGMVPGLDSCPRTATEQWIEDSVLEKLARAWKKSDEQDESISTLTKAILLLAIRDFSSFIRTKNPTWLKPGGLRPKISSERAFASAIERLVLYYKHAYNEPRFIKGGHIFFTDYDASLYIPEQKADIIMTSPPFCNRVNWDRIYAPERFFLKAAGAWHAITEFLGTTAVHPYLDFDSEIRFVTKHSAYVCQFLEEVRRRQIRNERSSDYYVKYYTRYFAGLFRVFGKSACVLREGNAGIYFVVQDNTHRGLFIQIGKALAEYLSSQDFQVCALNTWERHHLGLQNISRRHRLVTPKQKECIWHAFR